MVKSRFVSLPVALLVLILGLQPRDVGAEEPRNQAKAGSLKERIAGIAAEHEKQQTLFYDELRALSKRSKELGREEYYKLVSTANQKYREYQSPAAKALAELLKANASDPAVVEGIMLYGGPMSHSLGIVPEFKTILLGEQFTNPTLGKLCYQLRYNNNDATTEAILTAVAARHPLAEVRGLATYALAEYYRQTARDEWGRPLSDEDRTRLLTDAERHLKEVLANYADVKSPDGKHVLGKQAAVLLSRVKNIPNLRVGKPAPDLAGEDLDGKPIKLSDYRGKVVLLVYWGSWCGPCMAQVPHEREIVSRFKDKPFILLGVNCGDTREKAKQTATDKQMEWTNVWDGGSNEGPFQAAYDVRHWPTTYVIDGEGAIRHIDIRGAQLDNALDELLAE
jgi:peroxiredoxin